MSTPIIAFAKDWHEDPTSNHHVLRELAKTRRVLWLNSLATRKPQLGSARDMGKIKRKLGEFAKGPVNVENDLWVFSPLVLPLPHSPGARAVNRQLLRATISRLRKKLGIDKFQLWTFLPGTADYVGTLGEDMAVYYCVDEWSMFSYLDRAQTVAAEEKLLERVDVTFAINTALAEAKRERCPHTFVSPHGVDHALFARALEPATTVPADLAAIPGPRIGFYGTLRDWVDYELLASVARARPQWQIVLLGQVLTDVSILDGLPNVHLLGQKKHDELPAYCKGFDVGIIPYKIDERMRFVNPLKMREYLSAGLPVVSTDVPEVRRYPDLVQVANTPDEWVTAIERALANNSIEARAARTAAMTTETWSARVAQLLQTIDDVQRKAGANHGSEPRFELSDRVPFLVTGATGNLGRAIVSRLRAEGHHVRVFQRRPPPTEDIESARRAHVTEDDRHAGGRRGPDAADERRPRVGSIEYAIGDLADAAAVDRAVAGAQVVIHCGAATKGDWAEHQRTTVDGTQNVVDACKKHGVEQLVHISSMSVVDWAGSDQNGPVNEATRVEPQPDKRGAYTRAKLEAEKLVVKAARDGLPAVILRPGQIFGGGIDLINGAVARKAAGSWLVLGDGKIELPLVYIDDVVDAIVAAVDRVLVGGEIIQIIDPDRLTQDEVLDLAGGTKPVVRVPRLVVFALGKLSELPLGAKSPIGMYRLKSALSRLRYESDRAQEILGWRPRVGVREGIRRITPTS